MEKKTTKCWVLFVSAQLNGRNGARLRRTKEEEKIVSSVRASGAVGAPQRRSNRLCEIGKKSGQRGWGGRVQSGKRRGGIYKLARGEKRENWSLFPRWMPCIFEEEIKEHAFLKHQIVTDWFFLLLFYCFLCFSGKAFSSALFRCLNHHTGDVQWRLRT